VPTIDLLPEAPAAEQAAIVALLDEASRRLGFVWEVRPFVLALRDDRGAIVGGLIGELHWGWLRIRILAVAEALRGQGWGQRLIAEAERHARAAGCRHAWVDTFSFQARPFYERLGYRVFGELPDYPAGQTRFFLARQLGPEGG
jgi:GNAT superfamily N-acetyltransferase